MTGATPPQDPAGCVLPYEVRYRNSSSVQIRRIWERKRSTRSLIHHLRNIGYGTDSGPSCTCLTTLTRAKCSVSPLPHHVCVRFESVIVPLQILKCNVHEERRRLRRPVARSGMVCNLTLRRAEIVICTNTRLFRRPQSLRL